MIRALVWVPWMALIACGNSLAPMPAATTASDVVREESPLVKDGFVALGQKDGVTVYRREVLPGMELAAEGDIAASPERILRVLIDYPGHQKWQEHLAECRVLDQGEGFLDVYERLDLPLIDDRDFVLHVTWKKEAQGEAGDGWRIHFATVAGKGPPPQDGVVRVTAHEGGWVLTPIDGGKATHAVYRFHLDLAGSLPSWLGKDEAADDIAGLFDNVRKQLPNYP